MRKVTVIEKVILSQPLKKKAHELQRLGYSTVNEQSLWEYVLNYYWKRNYPEKISEKKQQISNITANDFFDYLQIKAQVEETKSFDWSQIGDLL